MLLLRGPSWPPKLWLTPVTTLQKITWMVAGTMGVGYTHIHVWRFPEIGVPPNRPL